MGAANMIRGRPALAVVLLALGSFGGVRGESSALCLRLRGSGSKELKIEHRAFVANLPRTLTDKGLREAFSEFGKIKEARVLKDIETGQSRRMGYVTFEDGLSLTEAIEEMHETEFCTGGGKGKP